MKMIHMRTIKYQMTSCGKKGYHTITAYCFVHWQTTMIDKPLYR
jgi:hypothetical protein